MTHAQAKQHAHELIDRMAPGQVSAVVGLLEIILDPLARTLANAPFEDEPMGAEEERTATASKAWLQGTRSIPNDEILSDFGLSGEDFQRMGQTPPEAEPHRSGD